MQVALAVVVAIALVVGGYVLHLRVVNQHLQTSGSLLRDAAQASKGAADRSAAELAEREALLNRLVDAQRQHAALLEELRSTTHAALERIKAEPDDGCLDRPIPNRLRTTPAAVSARRLAAAGGDALPGTAHPRRPQPAH